MIEVPKETALLFILSGPAGSGKSTLCDQMLQALSPRVQRIITATTRKPRQNETHGVDFYFMNEKEFKDNIGTDAFYEYAKVHGNYYGILKKEVLLKLNDDIDLLVNIDVQGADTLRKAGHRDPLLSKRVVSIFVMPKDLDQIRDRLKTRGHNSEEEISHRLKVAEEEVNHYKNYDYCIPSGLKDEDFACFMSIYASEKLRIRR